MKKVSAKAVEGNHDLLRPASEIRAGHSKKKDASVSVQIGFITYIVKLVPYWPEYEGKLVLAVCEFDKSTILISDKQGFERRVNCLWHEIAHAWAWELNITDKPIDGEALANLVGLGMSFLSQKKITELYALMRRKWGKA